MVDSPNPVGRPTDYRPEYCEQVVDFMRAGFSLTAFAGYIGVSRATLNLWMGAHAEFLEAVSRGKAARLLHWEEASIAVAKGGGGPGASTVIVFGLKNMAPEEYADTQTVVHSGTIKTAAEMDDDELAAIAAGGRAGTARKA